jgi:hypothetical protein
MEEEQRLGKTLAEIDPMIPTVQMRDFMEQQ